ncbi:MAG: Gp15 family bacteriophage protein [Eubacterium sp.]
MKSDFKNPDTEKDPYYDIFEDWGLIEASFTQQYGIRIRVEPEMTWNEFLNLLAGLNSETPLGKIVSIRSENNKDNLKRFTKDQRKIRMDWRNRMAKNMPKQSYEQTINNFEKAFAMAFGEGGD